MTTIFVIGVMLLIGLVLKYLKPKNKETVSIEVATQTIQKEPMLYNEDEFNDNYWIPVEAKKRAVKANLKIKYKNSYNQESERLFDVESFSRGEKGYQLQGFCHKYNKKIKLSSLGIIEAIELTTGIVIEDISANLESKYKGTIAYLQDSLFDDYGWAIYCLLFLASSSGSISKAEREIIGSFITSIQRFSNLDKNWIDTMLKESYRPGKMEVRNWLKSAVAKGYNPEILKQPIVELAQLQEPTNKEFWSFKKYIEQK